MKTFFNFTSAQWSVAISLLVVMMVFSLFYNLYENNAPSKLNLQQFEAEIEAFEREQQFLEDSMCKVYHQRRQASLASNYDSKDTSKRSKIPMYQIVKVNLNLCDTNDIMVVPQFGGKRAKKIVEYREQLGGYHDLKQLSEIYILRDLKLEFLEKYFTLGETDVKKINVNTADYKTMISHPYFDAYLTKTILNYRKKNGQIHNISEFEQITHAYKELIDKIEPYLQF